MLKNKMLWQAIGTTYVTIGFAVLTKRFAESGYWTYKQAMEELRVL